MTGFAFPPETQEFLAELRDSNDKAWFDAHRDRYRRAYLDAAADFVRAAAPVLTGIVPGLRAEPRVLGSIFRINRDTRFGADKRPYKDHLDLWFWEGERKLAASGLFLRVTPEIVGVGAGSHGFDKPALARYRAAAADPSTGGELRAVVDHIERAGYALQGQTYARVPSGYPDAPAEAGRLLRHGGLFVHHDEPGELARDPELLPTLAGHWRTLSSLHTWIVRHVQSE